MRQIERSVSVFPIFKSEIRSNSIDSLYESILKLKTLDYDHLEASPHHQHLLQDYNDILYLCEQKVDLQPILLDDSTKVLPLMKPTFIDLYSITTLLFLHAGVAWLVHFNLLLTNKQDRTLDTFYHTINTCPLIARAGLPNMGGAHQPLVPPIKPLVPPI